MMEVATTVLRPMLVERRRRENSRERRKAEIKQKNKGVGCP
jgi:hypothetical protein